jgi:hypothetical protein
MNGRGGIFVNLLNKIPFIPSMTEQKDYTVIYIIIHWAIAICMILILGTIFLRLTCIFRTQLTPYSGQTDPSDFGC